MAKGTTIRDALLRLEEKDGLKPADRTEVKLLGEIPPIEKMDASLSTLVNCVKLSLSTNKIDKIANVSALKHLKILSLGRNYIKSLTGLDAVAETLEELWISYNFIEKLKGVATLKNLRVLYISNNQVKDMKELELLAPLSKLEDLVFVGNPCHPSETSEDVAVYREEVKQKLRKLKKLDGETVIRPEDSEEQAQSAY